MTYFTDLLPNDYWWEEEMMFNSPCLLLKEGLIKSYPINDVIKAIARANSLIIGNKMVSILNGDDYKGCIYKFNSANEGTNLIYVIIPKGEVNKSVIDDKMIKYGWVCTKKMEYVYSSDYQKLLYERKFDVSANNLVYKQDFIYHICPNNKVDKILKQGLLPKENTWQNWETINNPMGNDYRVYFFIQRPDDFYLSQWKQEFETNKKASRTNNGYTLLKIDVSKLKDDLKFYLDPRTKNGIYTREVIPNNAIKKVKDI